MNRCIKTHPNPTLIHYGVQGMHWGVRKDYRKVKRLYRITKTKDESNIPDGYYTTSLKEAKVFKSFIQDTNDIPGTKIFSMKVKLKDLVITPSEKEEVEIQLELLKDKKVKDLWADALTTHALNVKGLPYRLAELDSVEEELRYLKTPESKAEYGDDHSWIDSMYKGEKVRLTNAISELKSNTREDIVTSITVSSNKDSLQYFSMAVYGNSELRKIYRDTLISKGYNAAEDHWGQSERKPYSGKLASPSAIILLDKRIINTAKVR